MTDRIPDDVLDAVEREARYRVCRLDPECGAMECVRWRAILRLIAAYRASAPVLPDAEEVCAHGREPGCCSTCSMAGRFIPAERAPVPASVPVVWERDGNGDGVAVTVGPLVLRVSSQRWWVGHSVPTMDAPKTPHGGDIESAKAAAIEAAREVTRKLAEALGM